MRNSVPRLAVRLLLLTAFALVPAQMHSANLNSNVSAITLTATLPESLTLSASPGSVTFNLVAGGTATGSAPVAITTTWVLAKMRTAVNLYGSFASSTTALTDGAGDNIPSSDVLGQVPTGLPTTFTAFTQMGPFGPGGASLQLFNQMIMMMNLSSNRTDNLNLEIKLTGTTLPAATYTGTLNLQAQAM